MELLCNRYAIYLTASWVRVQCTFRAHWVGRPHHALCKLNMQPLDHTQEDDCVHTLRDFEVPKAFLIENAFRRIENVLDNVAESNISVDDYERAYTTVYRWCAAGGPPYNMKASMQGLLKSQVERCGGKYPRGSKLRTLYVKFLSRVFNYLTRFTLPIGGDPWPIEEWIDEQMEKGKPRAAALERWRLVKSKIVYAERNAKIKARVDRWLIENELDDFMDAKSKVPCFRKRASIEGSQQQRTKMTRF